MFFHGLDGPRRVFFMNLNEEGNICQGQSAIENNAVLRE